MRQWLKVLGLVLLGSVATQAFTDGPLTPWPNARGRTDENGYVIVSSGTPGTTGGPLTPFSNLRVRTDENGYLRVSLANAVLPSAGCVSWNGDTWLQRTAAGKLGISGASCGGSNLGTLTLGTILFGTDNTGDIGASGATRPRTVHVGTSVSMASSGRYVFSSRSKIGSSGDNLFELYNNAETEGVQLRIPSTGVLQIRTTAGADTAEFRVATITGAAYNFNGTSGKTGATCSAFTVGGCTTSPEPDVYARDYLVPWLYSANYVVLTKDEYQDFQAMRSAWRGLVR